VGSMGYVDARKAAGKADVTTKSFPKARRAAAGSGPEPQGGTERMLRGLPRREALIDRRAREVELPPETPVADEREQRIVEGLLGLSIFVLVSTSAFVFFQQLAVPDQAAASSVTVVAETPAPPQPLPPEAPRPTELDGIPLKQTISDGWFSEPLPAKPRRMSEPPEM